MDCSHFLGVHCQAGDTCHEDWSAATNSCREMLWRFLNRQSDVPEVQIKLLLFFFNIFPCKCLLLSNPQLILLCLSVHRGVFYQGYLCSKCGLGAHKECLGRFGSCGKTGNALYTLIKVLHCFAQACIGPVCSGSRSSQFVTARNVFKGTH